MKKIFVLFTVFAVICGTGTVQAQVSSDKSSQIVRIADKDYYLHTVSAGQTIYSLTKLYGISSEQLYEYNPAVKENGLKAGEVVKIVCTDVPEVTLTRRKMQKTFSIHNVQIGETTYSIAKQYSLSVKTLIDDNPGIDPTHLQVGQEIRIRKSEMDKTSPQDIMEQMDDFANKLSIVSDEYNYHLVEIGETLYGISKKYNVSIEVIEANNGIKDGLRAGLLLRIPIAKNLPVEVVVPEKETYNNSTVSVNRNNTGTMNISVLLPLTESGVLKNNFMELYQGSLIAADELREKGNNVILNLYNTEHSAEAVRKITAMHSFQESDLIIGPVYEEGLKYVVDYSAPKGIPVVSPLANIDGAYGKTLFQLSPEPKHRNDKLHSILEDGKNIVFITSDVTDAEFEREMKAVVGNKPYQKIVYRKGTPSGQINALMADSSSDNVFIVVAGNESGVDLILAAISSIQNTRLSRSQSTGAIRVIGNSKWNKFRNVDRNLYFKLNVTYVTSYHADRGNLGVVDFDNRYIAAFGQIPSLYSYRGYDAVMMFGQAVASGNPDFMNALKKVSTPLETVYEFNTELNGNISNTGWALVMYGNDYTITVK